MPKKAAFFAATALQDRTMLFEKGDLSLSVGEKLYKEKLEELGRPDLADCVASGKKYLLLQAMFRTNKSHDLPCLLALHEAFEGQRPAWKTIQEWEKEMREKFRNNGGWKEMLGRSAVEQAGGDGAKQDRREERSMTAAAECETGS